MRRRNANFPDNGFEAWGGYMQAKISKLEEQYTSRAHKDLSKLTDIFNGISIFVNGYTYPSAEELKGLMCQHGGIYHTYHKNDDYIIASNLPDTKVKKMSLDRVVRPEWITESIAACCLLDYKKYLLYNTSRSQPKLMFNSTVHENMSVKNENYNEIKVEITNTSIKFKENEIEKASTEEESTEIVSNTIKSCDSKTTKTAADPNFISEFYNNSRLHHISQLGANFKQHVNELREQSKFEFPAREKLKQAIDMSSGNKQSSSFDGDKTIMHIDMDCFFVSVGLRTRPELCGRPVAVTHSKGGQSHSKRPGVDRNVEFNLYKQKQMKKLGTATGLDQNNLSTKIETRVDNITDEDDKFGSMSEIASCSYEARAKGITNGMFMGNALRLCPELQTIPYDFDGYKEVAYTLYNTIAQYTLDIEAVSCDEMYVDCTELLKSMDVSVKAFASALREEIREKTGCPCSTGFGGNRLQARLATKQAKPDGQFFLFSNLVKDYMFAIKLKDLPGVGRQIACKLVTLGHTTCGSLQSVPLTTLQQHLGNKTGCLLFEQCRGVDSHHLSYYNVRKSVSAEVNYGIRFENDDQCFEFLRQLANEVNARMLQFKVFGKCVTLKLMVRAAEAPVETAKFMGHGFCNVINKSSIFSRPTNEADLIFKEVICIIKKLKVDPKELRGVGIQMTKLESNNHKEIKGTMSRFLSSKPLNETNQSTRNVDVIATVDRKNTSYKITLTSPKKKIHSPGKQKSPIVKNKSPMQKRRGRPPKSPRITAASKNLLSKFIQGQSFSYFKEEFLEDVTTATVSSDIVNTSDVKLTIEKPRGILGLDWERVRELLRAWLDSEHAPLPCDVQLIVAYLRDMVVTRRTEHLTVLIKFLLRKTSEITNSSWKDVSDEIVEQVQNAMLAVYGKKLYIS